MRHAPKIGCTGTGFVSNDPIPSTTTDAQQHGKSLDSSSFSSCYNL